MCFPSGDQALVMMSLSKGAVETIFCFLEAIGGLDEDGGANSSRRMICDAGSVARVDGGASCTGSKVKRRVPVLSVLRSQTSTLFSLSIADVDGDVGSIEGQ